MARRLVISCLFGLGTFAAFIVLIFIGHAAFYTIADGATAPAFLPMAMPYAVPGGVAGMAVAYLWLWSRRNRRERDRPE